MLTPLYDSKSNYWHIEINDARFQESWFCLIMSTIIISIIFAYTILIYIILYFIGVFVVSKISIEKYYIVLEYSTLRNLIALIIQKSMDTISFLSKALQINYHPCHSQVSDVRLADTYYLVELPETYSFRNLYI